MAARRALQRFETRLMTKFPPRLQKLWNSDAGPKTIFFWAPTFKWCLVVAGFSDLARPVETLSVRQSGALAATGVIWARYSLVIIPRNLNLFACNLFLGMAGLTQLFRIAAYYSTSKEKEPQQS